MFTAEVPLFPPPANGPVPFKVVPHEVMGMSNFNKNLFVGLGGKEAIDLSHFIGACYGMEKMMGRADNPLRRILNRASDDFLTKLPLVRRPAALAPHCCCACFACFSSVVQMLEPACTSRTCCVSSLEGAGALSLHEVAAAVESSQLSRGWRQKKKHC